MFIRIVGPAFSSFTGVLRRKGLLSLRISCAFCTGPPLPSGSDPYARLNNLRKIKRGRGESGNFGTGLD